MQTLQNPRFLQALLRQPVDRTPVWIMRQAGRYLPEYRQTRERAGSFLKLCQTPELACEVSLQPLARFALDAVILFSDILTVPMAMGMQLDFVAGEGPVFAKPLRDSAAIHALNIVKNGELDYVGAAAKLVHHELAGKVPLIGFAGSPWTVATYMVEGGASKDYRHIKGLMFTDSALLHQLLDKITQSTIDYLNMQVAAGAQALMVFDTWGGVLSPEAYRQFSLAYMQRIANGVCKTARAMAVPIILFTKNGGENLAAMADVGADALGVDWTLDLATARARVQDKVALQGNLDPAVLYGNERVIEREVGKVLASFGEVGAGAGHVFNLGHGIHQFVEPEKVAMLIQAIDQQSRAYHP